MGAGTPRRAPPTRARLLIASLILVLAASLASIRLAQVVGGSAVCAASNHVVADPRLLVSTYVDLGSAVASNAPMVRRSHLLYVAAGPSVAKIDRQGRLVATLSMPGPVSGLSLDHAGDLYVTGWIIGPSSKTRPTSVRRTPGYRLYGRGGYDDTYVLKESASGELMWRTDMGGIYMDEGGPIAVTSFGKVWISGITNSHDFPLLHPFKRRLRRGAEGAWIAELDSTGKLVFSSYFGGSSSDEVQTIAVDRGGLPLLLGWASSPDFAFTHRILVRPPPGGACTAVTFVMRLTRQGRLRSSTPLMHCGSVGSALMDMEPSGEIDVAAGNEIFTLDPSASRIVRHISLGRYAEINALALGPRGSIAVTGDAMTPGLRVVSPLQAHFHKHICGQDEQVHNCTDALVSVVNSRGQIRFASYVGGTRDDSGEAIAVDRTGRVYVVGTTDSTDFPLRHAPVCSVPGSAPNLRGDGPTTSFFTSIKP